MITLYYVLRQDEKARRVDLHTDLNWSQSAVYKFQYLELGNFNFAKKVLESNVVLMILIEVVKKCQESPLLD